MPYSLLPLLFPQVLKVNRVSHQTLEGEVSLCLEENGPQAAWAAGTGTGVYELGFMNNHPNTLCLFRSGGSTSSPRA